MKSLGLLLLNVIILGSWSFPAMADYSGYKCVPYRSGAAPSLCKGRNIPAAKARNFDQNSQELDCSSNVDHYVRRPQKFDFNAWATFVQNNKSQEAYDLRRQQKDISWRGAVPFMTVETWVWQDCQLVTDAFKCGTTTKTKTYDCSYTTPQKCDPNGKCTDGKFVSKTCTEKYQDPNSCQADIDQREYWDCSHEVMTYNAKYDRPADWTPQSPDYKDAIPNKYDLLPGEVEDVQVLNNQSSSNVVKPFIVIGDAWNEYTKVSKINGTEAVRCQQDGTYHADVTIYTNKRLPNKKTPNAFRLPHDVDGHKIPALESDPVQLNDGQQFDITEQSNDQYTAGHPSALKLDDTSSSMIGLIAEQSRKNAFREQSKEKMGLGSNDDAADELKKDPGFFKNTKVRVELVSDNKYWWNTSSTDRIIVDDIDAVQMDFRAFSTNPDIAFSDLWKIILNDPKKRNNNIYITSKDSARTLRPDQNYILKVSMYQKGARGFYKQDCDEDPNAWDCKWWSLFFHRSERDYFSDSLQIHFKTPETMKDERGFGRKFLDTFDIF